MVEMARRSRNAARPAPLSDVDLRQLRVFAEIVRCGGFTAAQGSLGMNQATISTHMRKLEERLGLRLCERGRSGFVLTEEGKQIHSAALDLFGSLERFQSTVGDTRGELGGQIGFATVDAMVTNRKFDLSRVFAAFRHLAPRVRLEVDIAAPQEVIQGIRNGRYQLALIPGQAHAPMLHQDPVFHETQNLYCGPGHALFDRADAQTPIDLLSEQAFAARSYMPSDFICGVAFQRAAVTGHMEGTLMLVLSGGFIGFLPDHYADPYVATGKLRAIRPDQMTFQDEFCLISAGPRLPRAAGVLSDLIRLSVNRGSQ